MLTESIWYERPILALPNYMTLRDSLPAELTI